VSHLTGGGSCLLNGKLRPLGKFFIAFNYEYPPTELIPIMPHRQRQNHRKKPVLLRIIASNFRNYINIIIFQLIFTGYVLQYGR